MALRAGIPRGEGDAVVAVGGEQVIVRPHGGVGADGDRFLSDVEVEETADFSPRIGPSRLFFEATDRGHLAVELEVKLVVGRRLVMAKAGTSRATVCARRTSRSDPTDVGDRSARSAWEAPMRRFAVDRPRDFFAFGAMRQRLVAMRFCLRTGVADLLRGARGRQLDHAAVGSISRIERRCASVRSHVRVHVRA